MSKKVSKKIAKLESLKKQVAEMEASIETTLKEGKPEKKDKDSKLTNKFHDLLEWRITDQKSVLVGILKYLPNKPGQILASGLVIDITTDRDGTKTTGLVNHDHIEMPEKNTAKCDPTLFKETYKQAMKALKF